MDICSFIYLIYTVNVFGVTTMCQAFIPLLRTYYTKSPLNSRIINISSGSGRISAPSVGQYSATKVQYLFILILYESIYQYISSTQLKQFQMLSE